MATRCKLGRLGTPLLGQRQLATGRVGWDVASLEFRLRAVRATREAGRRALRRRDRGRASAVPAGARADARRHRRHVDVPRTRARRATGRPHAGRSSTASFGRGVRRHRASLPGRADRARACERPDAVERARPGPAAARAGPYRATRPSPASSSGPPAPTLVHVVQPVKGSSRSPSGTACGRPCSRARTASR